MMGESIRKMLLLVVAFWAVAAAMSCSPDRDGPVPDPPVENIPDEEDPEEEPDVPDVPDIPDGDANTEDIAGTWHLTRWSGSEPTFEVYLSITVDGSLTLWQRIDSYSWEVFVSAVNYGNGKISGVYSDGVGWAASYMVTLDGDLMTWTSVDDDSDVSVYSRKSLPDDLP